MPRTGRTTGADPFKCGTAAPRPTTVTCAANALIGEVHDRLSVILDERAAEDWMNPRENDPTSLKRLLVPASPDLRLTQPASPLVNRVKNEGGPAWNPTRNSDAAPALISAESVLLLRT